MHAMCPPFMPKADGPDRLLERGCPRVRVDEARAAALGRDESLELAVDAECRRLIVPL